MLNDSPKKIQIEFTVEFKRNIRQLSKKYRHIKSDIQPIIESLESGDTPGKQVKGTKYTVFKVRVKNTDIHKGKRSGYRIIYYLKKREKIILVTIYSKNEQGDISMEMIRNIIKNFEKNNLS